MAVPASIDRGGIVDVASSMMLTRLSGFPGNGVHRLAGILQPDDRMRAYWHRARRSSITLETAQ